MPEDLQYRLFNASIMPPGDAWPKIAEQLDKETQEKLSLKLQAATLAPPASAWQNILEALNEADYAHETKIIPLTRRRNWLAAAAIVAGIIVLGTLYYLTSGNGTDNQTATKTDSSQNNPLTPGRNNQAQATENISNATQRPEPVLIAANTLGPVISIRNNRTARVRYARVKNKAVDGNAYTALNTDGAVEQPVSTQTRTGVPPKAYLTISAPNGQPARISTKFSDAVGYLLGNEPADNMSAALKSISWKKRFSSWSNKLMMNPGFIPAATNFLDIMELEELLKE